VAVDGTSGVAVGIGRDGKLGIAVGNGDVVTVEAGEVAYDR
jgi:biotin-(acetyl-CoA carboxylase) ligase